MSENFNGEYQMPTGDYSTSSQPIYDELDKVYQGQIEINKPQMSYENVINPASQRLYEIADNLAEARADHISKRVARAAEEKKFISAVARTLFNRNLSPEYLRDLAEKGVKKEESAIGASIFGNQKPNERIEFFNDNRASWFFYQSITDASGNIIAEQTFHYEVLPEGIMRISNGVGMNCKFIEGQELDNFMSATEIYYDRVMNQLYNYNSDSSKKAA